MHLKYINSNLLLYIIEGNFLGQKFTVIIYSLLSPSVFIYCQCVKVILHFGYQFQLFPYSFIISRTKLYHKQFSKKNVPKRSTFIKCYVKDLKDFLRCG